MRVYKAVYAASVDDDEPRALQSPTKIHTAQVVTNELELYYVFRA